MLASLRKRIGLTRPQVLTTVYRLLPGRSMTVHGIEAKFKVSSQMDYRRTRNLNGEIDLLEALITSASPGDVFWDVGAHYGWYSVFMAKAVSPGGSCISFEPHPEVRKRLKQNLDLNGCSNVLVLPYAVSARNGEASFYAQQDAGSGRHSLLNKSGNKALAVPTRSGATLVGEDGYAFPTMLKIDVEGAEYEVLEGMGSILSDPRLQSVLVEFNPSPEHPDPKAEAEARFKEAGFTEFRWSIRLQDHHLFARRS